MMPYRGHLFSRSGKSRKNIPPAATPSQPTPPSFNVPTPQPSTVQPAGTPPAAAFPPIPQPVPVPPQMPIMPLIPPLPYTPQPMLQPSCPYINIHTTDGMYEDTDEIADMSMYSPNIDPPRIVSNNPAILTVSLFKELTSYPNYGNPSGNADILYTGNQGTWSIDIPSCLLTPGQAAQIIIRAVLDDHYNVPANRYSLRITVNGTTVHNGLVPLAHGTPGGTLFNNWRPLTFNVSDIRRVNRVVIVNTSTAGQDDWIAFDWMELRLISI